jgi:hypothetical protein
VSVRNVDHENVDREDPGHHWIDCFTTGHRLDRVDPGRRLERFDRLLRDGLQESPNLATAWIHGTPKVLGGRTIRDGGAVPRNKTKKIFQNITSDIWVIFFKFDLAGI